MSYRKYGSWTGIAAALMVALFFLAPAQAQYTFVPNTGTAAAPTPTYTYKAAVTPAQQSLLTAQLTAQVGGLQTQVAALAAAFAALSAGQQAGQNSFGPPYTPNANAPPVFAHYVLAIADYGGQVVSYEQDIREAAAQGIDGFVLNFGGNTFPYPTDIANFFQAANSYNTGSTKKFYLCLNPDMSGSLTAADITSLMTQYGHNAAYYQFQGRPFLSTYGGAYHQTWAQTRAFWQSGVLTPLRSAGVNPYFVPDFAVTDASGNYIDSATAQQAEACVSGLYQGLADGGFQFLGGQVSQVSLAAALHAAGLTDMGCVCPQYWQSKAPGRNYYESFGGEGMAADWTSIIGVQHSEFVELVTWNDADEASNFTNANISQQWPYLYRSAYPGYYKPKLGTQAEACYFIQWYKMGAAPAITTDSFAYYYRTQPKAIVTADPNGPVGNLSTALDDIFITTFCPTPASLVVTSGTSAVQTVAVAAGIAHTRIPFTPGAQSFALYRNGAELLSAVGEPIVSSAPVYDENYTTGYVHN